MLTNKHCTASESRCKPARYSERELLLLAGDTLNFETTRATPHRSRRSPVDGV